MNLEYKSNKLEKILTDERKLRTEYGHISDKLMSLMTVLKSANNLEYVKCLPQYRLHELKHNRRGEWALDITGYCRLIISFTKQEDLQLVTIIKILEVSKHYE